MVKPKELDRIIAEKKERLKELACINRTTQILKEGKAIDETLFQIVRLLPPAWQYPELTVARIRYDGIEYNTSSFKETPWKQSQPFQTIHKGLEGFL